MFLRPVVPIVGVIVRIVVVRRVIVRRVVSVPVRVIIARIPTVMIAIGWIPNVVAEIRGQPIMSWHLIMMVSIIMWLGKGQCA